MPLIRSRGPTRKRQPQQSALIARRNPISRELAFVWSGLTDTEITKNLRRTTNNTTSALGRYGRAIQCAAGQTNLEWNTQFCTTSTGNGLGDFTMSVLANPQATGAAVEHVFAQKNDAVSPFSQAGLYAHTDAAFGILSGSFAFNTYNGGGATSGVSAAGACDGEWHLWTGVRRGTTHELYKDGTLVASSALTVQGITQAESRFTAIGSRGNGTTGSYRNHAALAAMFNRALSATEVAALFRNPWQILEGDTRDSWFATASGTNLVLDNVAHEHTLGALTLTQTHSLAQENIAHGHALDSIALTQAHALALEAIAHANALDTIALTQTHNLALVDVAHSHTLDSVALTQAHNLVPADVAHAHTIDSVALNVGGTLLIADIVHAHNLDSINFTQTHNLSLANSAHAHTLESVALSQAHNLALENIAHGHTAQAIAFGAGTGLLVGSPGYLINRTARNWSINRTARNWSIKS